MSVKKESTEEGSEESLAFIVVTDRHPTDAKKNFPVLLNAAHIVSVQEDERAPQERVITKGNEKVTIVKMFGQPNEVLAESFEDVVNLVKAAGAAVLRGKK